MTEEELFFILKIESKQAVCPKCSQLSDKAHSRYTRCFKDLPISGLAVRIQLISRKWFCIYQDCSVKVFTERYSWMQPYARMTNRLDEAIRKIGFSTNCLTAEKVCHSLGIPLSHNTILRKLKEPFHQPIEVSPFCRN